MWCCKLRCAELRAERPFDDHRHRPVCLLLAEVAFNLTYPSRFTAFSKDLLLQSDFEWTIHTDKLRVEALGTIFDNVALSKTVSFKAFNGLPGVTISNFELPADTADGIEISTDSQIPSPARKYLAVSVPSFADQKLQNLASNLARSNSTRSLTTWQLAVSVLPLIVMQLVDLVGLQHSRPTTSL